MARNGEWAREWEGPGIDGRGCEGDPIIWGRVWGQRLPLCRAPAGGSGSEAPQKLRPQKLKPKNGLDASRKAFGDVECQVYPSEPTL